MRLNESSTPEPLPPPPLTGASVGAIPLKTTGLQLLPDESIQKITAGDVVGVSIYTSGGGLFGSSQNATGGTETAGTSQNTVTSLPAQMVDSSGEITVPHVGQISVAGHTPAEVEREIVNGLNGKAFEPSAIVTIDDRRGGDLVTVTGDVGTPRRIPVPMSGLRVVDAVAAAGGSTGKDFETMVTVFRGTEGHTERYQDIVENPAKNVFLQAGDTVVVKLTPWTFTSWGATGQTEHHFPTENVTAEEALGSVNGLDDNKANPEAVFVYRFESPSVVTRLGVKPEPQTQVGVPVVYQIDLRDPGGLFMAKQFPIHDKDVIFVGNAGAVGVLKVMTIVGALTAPVVTGLSAASGAEAIKSISQ
jgi:polysaccharide export outer membrane protein